MNGGKDADPDILQNHESCVVTAGESLMMLAGLKAILNIGWRRTLMKCMQMANEVKGNRCARLFWKGLQKRSLGLVWRRETAAFLDQE